MISSIVFFASGLIIGYVLRDTFISYELDKHRDNFVNSFNPPQSKGVQCDLDWSDINL